MTEAEVAELVVIWTNTATSNFTVLLSIYSAYFIAAYAVGGKLTSTQVLFLNVLFAFSALMFVYATAGSLLRQNVYVEKLRVLAPNDPYFMNENVAYVLGIFVLLGIPACLKFMWDVRHPKTE
jgi:hypothetical protein